jgi:hypothetical protein
LEGRREAGHLSTNSLPLVWRLPLEAFLLAGGEHIQDEIDKGFRQRKRDVGTVMTDGKC